VAVFWQNCQSGNLLFPYNISNIRLLYISCPNSFTKREGFLNPFQLLLVLSYRLENIMLIKLLPYFRGVYLLRWSVWCGDYWRAAFILLGNTTRAAYPGSAHSTQPPKFCQQAGKNLLKRYGSYKSQSRNKQKLTQNGQDWGSDVFGGSKASSLISFLMMHAEPLIRRH